MHFLKKTLYQKRYALNRYIRQIVVTSIVCVWLHPIT